MKSSSLSELLAQIEQRIAAASPGPWTVEREKDALFSRTGRPSGENRITLEAERWTPSKVDLEPASVNDVEFIAAARNSLPRLVAALRADIPSEISASELERLRLLEASATPAPWEPFLESRGPMGGDSFIRTYADAASGSPPDLYVSLGDQIAPDADIEFIAESRQDVPRLLSEVRGREAPSP